MESNKKQEARLAMLKQFSKAKSGEAYEPTIGKKLSEKKAAKAPPKSEEEPELTKAQQILKAKLGAKLGLADSEEDEEADEETEEVDAEEEEESEEEEHDCETCPVPSCPECDAVVAAAKK